LQFQQVYQTGTSVANSWLVLYVFTQEEGNSLVGVAAGRRLGSAVVRNRIKRLLREAYRLEQRHIVPGKHLILVGRQRMKQAGLAQAKQAFIQLCRKAGVWKECADK